MGAIGTKIVLYDCQHSTEDSFQSLIRIYKRTRRIVPVCFRNLVASLSGPERATHLLHPYPAKLLVHIPFFFLATESLSRKGDLVLDPFCGSGTVLLEAQLARRVAVGADANPLARLISKVKTTPYNLAHLRASATRLDARIQSAPTASPPEVINAGLWFSKRILSELARIRGAIARTRSAAHREFFEVCLSVCSRRLSYADPRVSVPVRLNPKNYPLGHPRRADSIAHLESLTKIDVHGVFNAIVETNLRRLGTVADALSQGQSADLFEDARSLRSPCGKVAEDETVSLVITSPPYPGAQKYIRASSFGLGWLGMIDSEGLAALKARSIGREEYSKHECRSLATSGLPAADRLLKRIHAVSPVPATIGSTYLREMREAIREMHRVLKPNGHAVIVVAPNSLGGFSFSTPDFLEKIATEEGFVTLLRLRDQIRARSLMTKRHATAGMIENESVLVFQKCGAR